MIMRPHTEKPCEKRQHQGETGGREYHRYVHESKAEVVWTLKRRDQEYVGIKSLESVPPGRRKEDARSRDGWTVSNKTR